MADDWATIVCHLSPGRIRNRADGMRPGLLERLLMALTPTPRAIVDSRDVSKPSRPLRRSSPRARLLSGLFILKTAVGIISTCREPAESSLGQPRTECAVCVRAINRAAAAPAFSLARVGWPGLHLLSTDAVASHAARYAGSYRSSAAFPTIHSTIMLVALGENRQVVKRSASALQLTSRRLSKSADGNEASVLPR
jgi:hypothetical protein